MTTVVPAVMMAADVATQAELDDFTNGVGVVTATMLADTLNLSGKTITMPASLTPALTKSYTSSGQTITSAGSLVLAHGLGAMPALIQCRLKCLTGEIGYTVGDEVMTDFFASYAGGGAGQGVSIVPDSTNLNIRFGSTTTVFALPNKTTGTIANATNANWQLIVRAWV